MNEPAWADGLDTIAFPALEGTIDAEACVIGLGGSGLTCVHELLDLGVEVVGIDAGIVGGGAAGRNGGFLLAGTAAFHHDAVKGLGRARARRIYELTIEEMDRIAAQAPLTARRTGSLRLAGSDAEALDCRAQLRAMRADDLPVEEYEGPEGKGLLFPTDSACNPLARCRSLAQRAASRGALLFEHSRATTITTGNVSSASGTVRCRSVIVAVDGGLEYLLPELAGRVRTARLQMLATGPVPEHNIPRPVYRRWGYDYWQQLPDKSVVLGGGRDRFLNDEWTTDNTPTAKVQQYMEAVLRDTVGVTQPVRHRWAASVSYSTGILPVMEQVRPGVWAIGGYSGTGNVIGSLYGRMVAQVATTGTSDLLSAFAPTR
ncbi:MAG: FAD-dependent oxidoreductase [Gemmatimonadaceae bacterium]